MLIITVNILYFILNVFIVTLSHVYIQSICNTYNASHVLLINYSLTH